MEGKTRQITRVKETPEIMANRRHVLGLFKADGVPASLDLSDDKQYDFLINLRGGRDYLENYFPHNYQLLQAARQNAIEAKNSNAAVLPGHITLLEKVANGEDVSTDWHDNIQLTGLVAQQVQSGQNATRYQLYTTGIVSFVEGLEVLSATLQIYSTQTGAIIATTSMENLYENGYDTVITAHGTTGDLEGIEAALAVDYLPYNNTVKQTKIVKIELEDKIDPSSKITVTDPVHKAARPNVGFIKVCMGRHDADCDYQYAAQPQPQPPIPNIAVSGEVTFPGTITDPCAGTLSFGALFFVKRRAGGSTQLFTDPTQICRYFTVKNGNTISWNFQPATFEREAPWTQGNEVDLNLTVQVSVNSNVKNAQFQVTSLKGVPESISVAKIDVLKFFWGCLSADALVLMADNTQKRIDSVRIGEMVQTDGGRCLEVGDIVTGNEEKPCLRIVTGNGRSLLVTDEHPVAGRNGFCLAKELRAGDLIKTQSGPEVISSITEERYDGVVYNLKLGARQDALIAGAVHYANGILVGDANMQGVLSRERENEARRPKRVEELPGVWRFDAENAERLREGSALIPV